MGQCLFLPKAQPLVLEFALIAAAAFTASLLTFFAGFGLGTILTPVFVVFLPPHFAVAATAAVHFLNNIFKITLLWPHINWLVLKNFGITAALGALAGALTLALLGSAAEVGERHLEGVIGLLISAFAVIELLPAAERWSVDTKWQPLGGFASGFFGGLSGHQGALRSIFLLRVGLGKEAFVATGTAIACCIDVVRIGTYTSLFDTQWLTVYWPQLMVATFAALAGAMTGRHWLKKVTLNALKTVVGLALLSIGFWMMIGAWWPNAV